jgi:hypothetical protein
LDVHKSETSDPFVLHQRREYVIDNILQASVFQTKRMRGPDHLGLHLDVDQLKVVLERNVVLIPDPGAILVHAIKLADEVAKPKGRTGLVKISVVNFRAPERKRVRIEAFEQQLYAVRNKPTRDPDGIGITRWAASILAIKCNSGRLGKLQPMKWRIRTRVKSLRQRCFIDPSLERSRMQSQIRLKLEIFAFD